ncbi:grainyhead-like [Mortierella polycephala]|uniref:Grainyhead-like n=1 Tax=Mortierella polycephala TaxID=41804 RepID=A0A9P6TXC6_9FUNG|nr:grainyhead-like [Mortierella polycephala]
MDRASNVNGDNLACLKLREQAMDTAPSATSVAAAAPESSTLAVESTEDSESKRRHDDHTGSESNGQQMGYQDQHSSVKEEDQNTQTIRRSRSGRLLRSIVQYDERSSRSSSPEPSTHGRRTRSSFQPNNGGRPGGDNREEASEQQHYEGNHLDQQPQDIQSLQQSENIGGENNGQSHEQGPNRLHDGDGNRDELASDGEQDDGYGDDGNNEGSESVDTNSSKNDDGAEPLVVSMYGSPSLVKVRSMFIDKLYKMVEDSSIQHLISWAKEGDMFYVFNCIELSSSVLPKFFKHNNWQSFVRQLNMYGFHKSQYYTISLEDTEEYDGEITSVIKVTFHDASHQRLAARYWSFWLSQQSNPKTARALDIEKASSSGMMEVQSKTFDRISFKWNGKAGAKLMVRFNCLSTDFSRIKGVKGIPLRVHMDTMLDGIGGHGGVISSNGDGSGNGDQQQAMERSFAKIKLFRDKGAERKNKDDHKHLEKMWDKMRGKNADTNPLVSMLAPVQSVSVFTECLDHPEGAGEDETLDLSETLTHDPDTDSGALATSGNNSTGASGTGSSAGTVAGTVAGANASQETSSSSAVESSVALVPATKKRRRAIESGGNSSSNGRQPGAQNQYHHSQVGYPTGSPSSSSELFLDRDPNYVPQSRKKKAVLCLYIKIGGESVYRAVYLEKCTLADLTQKLSEKLEIQSSTISCVYRKATKKELLVRVDDSMVAQMNDELDMVVDYDFNQLDGSVNLTLKY